jgi:hypothetical protein
VDLSLLFKLLATKKRNSCTAFPIFTRFFTSDLSKMRANLSQICGSINWITLIFELGRASLLSKFVLGISGVSSVTSSWQSKGDLNKKGSQIDLVFDRRDQVINLFELKFSINQITISKEYDAVLRHKIQSFKETTNTKKSIFLTMLSTHGLKENEYKNSAIQNDLTMDVLFLEG